MQTDRLPPAHLGGLAEGPDVELAVQARRRVVRDELEGETLRDRRAEPLGGLEPGRVSRAVVVAKAGDRRREDLELAARGAQRRALGVGAESLEQHQILVDSSDLEEAGGPELVERRR